jgi:ferritin-like metal-binding protein YciE
MVCRSARSSAIMYRMHDRCMARKNQNQSKQPDQTVNEKLVIYLNDALAVENAAIPRLQERIKQVSLPEAKEQLKHHLEETREQQKRLEQLISKLGGKPTGDSAELPIPSPPKRLANTMDRSLTEAEEQLIAAKEDATIENAEIVMYDTLSQLAQIMGVGDALPVIAQNLNEEKEMADWLRINMPAIITHLYPEIQSSISTEQPGAAEA